MGVILKLRDMQHVSFFLCSCSVASNRDLKRVRVLFRLRVWGNQLLSALDIDGVVHAFSWVLVVMEFEDNTV